MSRSTWSERKGVSSMDTDRMTQEALNKLKQSSSASVPAARSRPGFASEDATSHQAWVAKSAKQPMTLETVDLGPFAAEDVEIVVEHCGLCHSDLSVLNNDWG